MTQKVALITGVTGQDGAYLAEFLLGKGYIVHGLKRRTSLFNTDRIDHLYQDPHVSNPRFILHHGDMTDSSSLVHITQEVQPDEIYNLAAQSNPRESWRSPAETEEVNALGAQNLFEAAREVAPASRIFHASSSEMFGDASAGALDENTPLAPLNPYAAAKTQAHRIAQRMRREGRFIACGILFNHESPRRPMRYVVQKITYGAACIGRRIRESALKNENGEPIVREGRIALGNLKVIRDWGFAGDYVEAMWLALQHAEPEDFVIGTGVGHSIRDVCRLAFRCVGLDWEKHVIADARLVRQSDPAAAVANPARARARLGWAAKTSFSDLIETMVKSHTGRLALREENGT